ncbi:DgyrCDS7465 [Dimorphilus gyrociliatus]|uniref:DgyrCDS7465 n=1 Tax=Dimorphilus gyrociliatus TaxID=2664684 RepID=A0A7I8VSU2_9ANNE|nr:DgyrCDS7465 [Dimorphilus gyrociliatus]
MAPLLVILLAFLQISLQSEYVPVVLWGDKSINLKESLVGQTILESEFHNLYLKDLKDDHERSIILFSTSSLSIEDFSKYSDAYNEKSNGAALKNLKNRIENSESRQLISVENPFDAVMALGQNNVNLYKKYKIDSIANFPDIAEQKILLIVSLPEDAEESDTLINSVLNKFDSVNKKYLAIFTGEKSSSTQNAVRIGRHILEEKEKKQPVPTILKCGLIYLKGANISLNALQSKDPAQKYYVPVKSSDIKADCAKDGKATVTIPFEDGDKKIELSVELMSTILTKNKAFTNPPYQLSNYSVHLKTEKGEEVNFVSPRVDSVGPRKSFHCGNLVLNNKHEPGKRTYDVSVILNSYQIQMNVTEPKEAVFHNAEDCVGFFTTAIWSGLIAVFVLVVVLVFAILMIMDIKTMDRFDDPKGKHLNLGKTE